MAGPNRQRDKVAQNTTKKAIITEQVSFGKMWSSICYDPRAEDIQFKYVTLLFLPKKTHFSCVFTQNFILPIVVRMSRGLFYNAFHVYEF
jgi:hypothetical protein